VASSWRRIVGSLVGWPIVWELHRSFGLGPLAVRDALRSTVLKNLSASAEDEDGPEGAFRLLSCSKLLRGISVLLEDHGYPLGWSDAGEGWAVFATWPRDEFVANAKYVLNFPMAAVLRQSSPYPRPNTSWVESLHGASPLVFHGALRRRLKRWLLTARPSYVRFWGSWAQLKKACEAVPLSFVRAATTDHLVSMSTPSPSVVGQEFLRMVGELSGCKLLPKGFSDTSTLPVKASVGETRLTGGQSQELSRAVRGLPSGLFEYDPSQQRRAALEGAWGSSANCLGVSVRELRKFGHGRLDRLGSLVGEEGRAELASLLTHYAEVNDHQLVLDELRREREGQFEPRLVVRNDASGISHIEEHNSLTGLNGSATQVYLSLPREYVQRSPRARFCAVLEPLKVRGITPGNAASLFCATPFQIDVNRSMRRSSVFRALGRSLTVEDLAVVRDVDLFPGKELVYVSVDYKGATDTMSLSATLALADLLRLHYREHVTFESPGLRDTALQMLDVGLADLQSTLYYDCDSVDSQRAAGARAEKVWVRGGSEESTGRKGRRMYRVHQQRGQLMAAKLSFPILCLANYVAYSCALQEYLSGSQGSHGLLRRFRNGDLPVLVNGDDMLFRAPPDFFPVWFKHASDVGFVLSAGKNFVHSRYCTINSQLFDMEAGRELGLLPSGLITGQAKVTGRDWAAKLSIQHVSYEICRLSRDPATTFHRWTQIPDTERRLKALSRGGCLNWFVDPLLGGCGLEVPPTYRVRLTKLQYALACRLRLELADGSQVADSQTKGNRLEVVDARGKPLDTPEVAEPLAWNTVHFRDYAPSGNFLTALPY
jgi:hypothetical protein